MRTQRWNMTTINSWRLGLFAAFQLPGVPLGAQPPAPVPPAQQIVVHLSELGSGAAPAGVGFPRELTVTVAAVDPLTEVQLWADSELVATQGQPGPPTTSLRAVLTWTPAATGEVLLFARAIDALGRTAQSNVLRRTVREAGEALGFGLRGALQGETVRSIAEDLGVGLDELLRANPTLTADDPLAPGTDVAVPLGSVVVQTWIFVDSFESGSTSAWSQTVPARGAAAGLVARASPGPPQLTLSLAGCEVSVEASSSERTTTGLALYRLDPDSDAFTRVTTAAGASTTFLDPAGPGPQHYMVGAFTDTTLALSPAATIVAGADCGGTWTDPALALVGGVLRIDPSSPLEAAYLWLETPDGSIRVPEEEGSVVPRSLGGFDFSRVLPLSSAPEVTVSAVGLQDGTAVGLGSSTLIVDAGMGLGRILGGRPKVSLRWVEHPAPGEVLSKEGWVPDPGILSFNWSTNQPWVTHGLWQVTAYPVPAGVLDPVGVLTQGTVTGNGGVFSIDFSPLLLQPITGLALDTGPASYQQFAPPGGGGGGGGNPSAITLSQATVESLHLPTPEAFFIRIIPFAGDQALGQVSNNVLIHDGPKIVYIGGIVQIPDPGPGSYTMDVSILQEPAAPIANYAVCWQFVGWNFAAMVDPNIMGWGPYGKGWFGPGKPKPTWYEFYSNLIDKGQTTFCPSSGGGSSSWGILGGLASAFFDGIGGLASWVSGAFVYIKGWVVDAVTKAVGCETDTCKAAASLALDAALIYAGVPPSLPNFDQLVAGAKGDLSTLVVELAQDAGVPCSELATIGDVTGTGYTCEEAAAAAIDKVVDSMYESIRKTANSAGGLYFPPGLLVVPDPRSQPQPVQVEVTLHQTLLSPLDLDTCEVDFFLYSRWQPSLSQPTDSYPQVYANLPPTVYRLTSLPAHYTEGTHAPLNFLPLYVPDRVYEGSVFEAEGRHLPEFAPDAGPTDVAKQTYWIYRPIQLPTVSTYTLSPPSELFPASRSWRETPEAALRLHPDPPGFLEWGASYSVVAWSPCAGFVKVDGNL